MDAVCVSRAMMWHEWKKVMVAFVLRCLPEARRDRRAGRFGCSVQGGVDWAGDEAGTCMHVGDGVDTCGV